MENLYNIEREIRAIFEAIEDSGGEITAEQEELLSIKEENIINQLDNYYKFIINNNGSINAIKEEVGRLNNRKKSLEKKVETVKKYMLYGVQQYGESTKTGSKFIELPTIKISTRKSQVIQLDETRIELLIYSTINVLREIYSNSSISLGDNCDIEGLLDIININAKAEFDNLYGTTLKEDGTEDSSFIPFSIHDLDILEIEIINKTSLLNFISNENSVINEFYKNESNFNITQNTPKESFKIAINENKPITIAALLENQNLQMK